MPQFGQWQVSIHAPAWGATGWIAVMTRLGKSFNPRARVGRDPCVEMLTLVILSFNPRARVGRDNLSGDSMIKTYDVSIHAPAWGATTIKLPAYLLDQSFNPRARVGRD